ncbi:hypothetical protein FE257_004913 [Aspergillus nanangensis]|uniref:Uncharacterized protein n=1 Tax=Aspergillus nanangensis TaxID=2582783 RepID=A0AAD4GMA8_ASPNN|nr:hypothetical protein FE257_004913 [Aspergillus nanangensis]
MSRQVDRVTLMGEKKKMKVVVASCSRTGTLGLHEAMEMLGYSPYHMIDVMFKGREPHMKVFREGIIAANNRFSGIKRFEREDMDKWVGDCDCVLEMSSYVGLRALKGYAEDPEIKFILTERSPEKWARSMNNTVAKAIMVADTFPMNLFVHFDSELYTFFDLARFMYLAWSDGTMPGHPNNEAALRQNYIEYIRGAKEILPKDRLQVIKLEDGLGWEQICPFLELPIPEQPYPRGNEPDKFEKIIIDYLQPRVNAAMMKLGALVVPTLGVAGYLGWKYFDVIKTLRR